MPTHARHYLLFTDAAGSFHDEQQWQFVLQPIGEGSRIAAEDTEPGADLNRLELLAVVRGLEALDGPSRVTLLCGSRYVRRGIRHDLAQWREHDWRWERFGKLVPIRDLDLWQRVDRALAIHQVEYCFGLRSADGGSRNQLKNPQVEIRNPRFSGSRDVPVKQRFADWGHGVLSALAGQPGTALSRSA